MQLREFVAEILMELECIVPTNSCDLLIDLESSLSFAYLKNYLSHYINNDMANAEIDFKVLQPLCDLLSERWFYIKNTDACYPHAIHTNANQAYFLLAQKLSRVIPEQSYHLLMPSVGAIIQQLSRKKLSDFKLHEFILADDGTPIEILKCLDHAFENSTAALCHTNAEKTLLNLDEKERVIHHSDATREYYDAIVYYLKTNHTNDIPAVRQSLVDALKADDYHVKSSYGLHGKEKLIKAILRFCHNQKDFIQLFEKLNTADWQEFIASINDRDLETLMLNEGNFILSLQNKQNYRGHEKYDKAVLFCFAEIYKRKKTDVDDYQNPFGYFAPFTKKYMGKYNRYLMGYTEKQKRLATQGLQDFLAAPMRINELHTYLRKHQKTELLDPLYELGSDLSFITNQLRLVSDKKYFEKEKASFWNILG